MLRPCKRTQHQLSAKHFLQTAHQLLYENCASALAVLLKVHCIYIKTFPYSSRNNLLKDMPLVITPLTSLAGLCVLLTRYPGISALLQTLIMLHETRVVLCAYARYHSASQPEKANQDSSKIAIKVSHAVKYSMAVPIAEFCLSDIW